MSAAQLVIPAAGAGAGANDSQWQSELTIHNVGLTSTDLTLSFYRTNGIDATHSITVAPRQTVILENIVQETFGIDTGSGAIVIEGDPFGLKKLSVTSRTFNRSESGEFGQDIPAWTESSAAATGDTAVINGPVAASMARFNFGIFAPVDTDVEWMLVRQSGTVAASVSESYDAGTQLQYNQGIPTFLGVENEDGDVVYARITEGRAFVYGSIIQNSTNDPSFVPFAVTRENFAAQLVGIDLNEDGEVDIFDTDSDGVLDGEVSLSTAGFPNYFRVVVVDPEGNPVDLELVDASNDVRLLENGTVQWLPSSGQRGTAGVLIPVVFK